MYSSCGFSSCQFFCHNNQSHFDRPVYLNVYTIHCICFISLLFLGRRAVGSMKWGKIQFYFEPLQHMLCRARFYAWKEILFSWHSICRLYIGSSLKIMFSLTHHQALPTLANPVYPVASIIKSF